MAQGLWHEADYLALDDNYLVEFTDGFVDVLPMPNPAHQRIVMHLCDELHSLVKPARSGEVLHAPLPVRLRPGKFREPDVMFMLREHADRKGADFWDGADLVMEVVSDDVDSRERDHSRKRADYAEAGIPEYWIVDPTAATITVLTLHDGEYLTHGEFTGAQSATSALLAGFSMNVSDVFAAADAE